jgi:hypothetical protein
VITVVNPYSSETDIVANTDIASVYEKQINTNPEARMATMYNDDCINDYTCVLGMNNMNIHANPLKGIITMNTSEMMYKPNINFIGLDTIRSKVCEENSISNCIYSEQIITIRNMSALNTVVAADDFFNGNQGTEIIGNVLTNDSDPENDSISIIAIGSELSPIQIPQGSYYITDQGILHFNPSSTFTGSLDITYSICDNNSEMKCVKATAHLLIYGGLKLKVKAYLEGALMNNGNQLSSLDKPLMRDNLRKNSYENNKNCLPKIDPYKYAMKDFDITQKYQFVGQVSNQFSSIADSATVFSMEGENSVVDWVFVELRDKNNPTLTFASRSGLIQRDGDIVDVDGVSALEFPGVVQDSFYVVVRHRNHLGVMSLKVSHSDVVDFTDINYPVFDFGTTKNNGFDYTGLSTNNNVKFGYRAMWAGDFNGDGKLKFTSPNDDINYLFFDILIHPNNLLSNSNFDFAVGYYQGDFNLNGKAKFDNPNDDKNLLFGQIVLSALNTNYLSNFDHFIEQVP